MRGAWGGTAAGVVAAWMLLAPSVAGATSVVPAPAAGPGTGVAVAPNGRVFVAEPSADRVTVLEADGALAGRVPFPANAEPGGVGVGHDGRVWVTFQDASALGVIDPGTLQSDFDPALDDVVCSTRGIAALPGRTVVAAACGSTPHLVTVTGLVGGKATGQVRSPGAGVVNDLAVAGGKVFAPDFTGDVVRRYAIGSDGTAAVEATFPVDAGAQPNGIVAGGDGTIYVSLLGANGIARVAAGAADGTAAVQLPLAPADRPPQPYGLQVTPFGELAVGGRNAGAVRFVTPATGAVRTVVVGTSPWRLALSPDGDLWASDLAGPALRLVDAAPRAAVSSATPGAPAGSLDVGGTVDPRGNATTVTAEATPVAGGAPLTVELPPVSAGPGPVPAGGTITGLQQGTAYEVRLVATSARGTTRSAPVQVALPIPGGPPAPGPGPGAGGAMQTTPPPLRLRLTDVLGVPGTARCLSRRRLRVTVPRRTGSRRVVEVRVRVGRRPERRFRGRTLRPRIELTGLPAGRVAVRLTAKLASGTTVRATRTYRTCARR